MVAQPTKDRFTRTWLSLRAWGNGDRVSSIT